MRLRDKAVVVTGASKGIGRALALGLAREGARVVVNYRADEAGAKSVVDSIIDAGGTATAVRADVSRVADVQYLFRAAVDSFGALDVLVNNAAIPGWSRVLDVTEDLWDRVVGTNLKGTFFCSVEAAALMSRRSGGSIVNVSSNIAALGVHNLSVYAMTKGGIHALTRQLAVELAPLGIRVNTFAPGPTLVERNLADDPDYEETWGRVVPLGRAGRADEMVGPAVFLASDESSYVTGQVFYADGGWSIAGKFPEGHMEAVTDRHQRP